MYVYLAISFVYKTKNNDTGGSRSAGKPNNAMLMWMKPSQAGTVLSRTVNVVPGNVTGSSLNICFPITYLQKKKELYNSFLFLFFVLMNWKLKNTANPAKTGENPLNACSNNKWSFQSI